MTRNWRLFLFGSVLLITASWYAQPIIGSSSNLKSDSLITVSEELRQVKWVKESYEKGNYDFSTSQHGHLYYDIVLTSIHVTDWFKQIDNSGILTMLRLVSAFFGILSVFLLFQLVRRFIDENTAWLSAAMFCLIPLVFWQISPRAQPDTTHLFFILCSVYWIGYIPLQTNSKPFYRAIFFAGLAFSAKYSGFFLVPLIFLIQTIHECSLYRIIPARFESKKFVLYLRIAFLLISALMFGSYFILTPEGIWASLTGNKLTNEHTIYFIHQIRILSLSLSILFFLITIFQPLWSYLEANTPLSYNVRTLLIKGGSSLFLFFAVFAITSPYLLVNMEFIEGILSQTYFLAQDKTASVEFDFFTWLYSLRDPNLLDIITLVFAFGGFILSLNQLITYRLTNKQSILWISSGWIITYLVMLVFYFGQPSPRFLLPVIPFLILLSSYAIMVPFRKILIYFHPRNRPFYETIFIATIIVLYFTVNFSQLKNYREEWKKYATKNQDHNFHLVQGDSDSMNDSP